jgi:hypothetical protein
MTMNNKPVYLTVEGLAKLRAELQHLVTVERPRVASRIHDAKLDGDITENAEYEDAKQEQSFLEGRIATLEAQLKNAEVIEKTNGDRVGDLHHRRFGRGRPARGQDQQRVARWRRADGAQEGRQGHRSGPRRSRHLHGRQHPLDALHAVFWADELAARLTGPQVVNDSKTPSGTVHVGSLRGPVILDVIVRALRSRGLPTTLLYGIDDLDPMDAQAMLTPDATERWMGVPLANVPDPAGDCHPSYARHFAALFIDTFAGLGIRPDERDLPDRAGRSLHSDGPRSGRAGTRHLPPRQPRRATARLAASSRHLPHLRQGRHHPGPRLGWRDGRL